ncbi:MAG: GyrI-like domain-containing protein [Bacteroidales bacterium]|nr:GyrI-like domain-containing protein [Bacteroidales bacterium]
MAKITEIMLLQQVEQKALVIERQAAMGTFSDYIGAGFMEIGGYLEELGETTTDIPFVEYPGFEAMTEDNIRMVIGLYTQKSLPAKGDIQSITIPARKIAVCLHRGTYDALAELYNEMMQWIKEKGYEPTGASIEHYYTGPEVPEAEQVTRVVMPVK